MELVEMDKERKMMSELFFIIMKVGKEKEHTKKKHAIYFLCPLKKVPLLIGVHSWWSFGSGRSNDCTFWRGCIGGAVFGDAIKGCAILRGTIIGGTIV